MSKFFTLKEMVYSITARKHNIDNNPKDDEIIEHLNELMEFMDGVREKWGSAILVSSGYRCPELNSKLGGVKTSAHPYGYAADLIPANNKKQQFFEFFKDYLKDKQFDELIMEKSGNSIWIHFALKSKDGKQRRKIKTLGVK